MKFPFYQGRTAYPEISFPEDFSSLFSNEILDESRIDLLSRNKLVLLHTGRCGSTLLHHLIVPHACPPIEIFNKEAAGPILSKMGSGGSTPPVAILDYLWTYQKIYEASPFISVSITPWQLLGLYNMFPAIAEWLFKDSVVVVLLRRNIIKQAISYVSAIKSGVWHSFDVDEAKQPVALDLKSISQFIDLIVWGENSLEREPFSNFLSLARNTLPLSYEGLAENKEEIALMIMRELGLSTSASALYADKRLPVKQNKSILIDKAYSDILSNLPLVLHSGFVVDESFIFSRFLEF